MLIANFCQITMYKAKLEIQALVQNKGHIG